MRKRDVKQRKRLSSTNKSCQITIFIVI